MNCQLLLVIVACIARKFYSHAWECVDSGQELNGVKIYTPKHCVPTSCKVLTSSGTTVDGFNCAIGNTNGDPTACRDFETAVVTANTKKNESERFLSDVCQATLASIGLYEFSCKEVPLVSVSLALTIDLPTSGRTFSGPQDAVMAEFYSRNKTVDEYYSSTKVCRVFRFGNNDLSRFSPDDSIQVFYDCMGMGLQKEYSKALYYLSLSTYPWQAVLNYTIAYLAKASEGSMRLVAAAWRSTRRIHVVFQLIVGATAYRVQAKGGNFFFSKIVSSSSPSVEIEDIPPQTRIVTVMVEPVAWKHGRCPPSQRPCSPIEVTLHDSRQLNLPVEPPHQKENDEQFRLIVGVAVGTFAVVMIIILIVVFTRWKRWILGEKGHDSGKGQKVIVRDSDSDQEHRQEGDIEAQVHRPCDGSSGLAQVCCPDASVGTRRHHPNSERSPLIRRTQPSIEGLPQHHHDPCDTEEKRPVSPALNDCHSFSLQLSHETEVKRPTGQHSDHNRSQTFPGFCSDIQRLSSCGWSSDDGMDQRLSAGFHNGQFHDSDWSPESSKYICAEVEQHIWQPADDKMSTSLTAQNWHPEQPVRHRPDDALPARFHDDSEVERVIGRQSNVGTASSVENRSAPEGCENVSSSESPDDRQGDSVQDQIHSEETAVKTPVPVESVPRARSGLSEDRDRAQLHWSSPQNLPRVIRQSASSSSQSELNFQQMSWPSQSRLVAEGQSSDSLDCRPEEEKHLPVCEPRPAEHSFYQSDQYCVDTSHESDDNNERNARNVAGNESWNQEHASNGAAAVETVVPEHSPERWFQRIQNDRTRSLLARTGGNMGGQPVPRLPYNIECPWILSERQPNPAYESVERFTEQLFGVGVHEGAENGRLELRGDPPGPRISEVSNRFLQIADPVNRLGDPEQIWCRLGELQRLGHTQLEPVEDTESSSESNCMDREHSGEGLVRCGDLEGRLAGPELEPDFRLGGDVQREPVEDSESSS